MKKWYTCTPVAFKGDHTFFYRDSGLFSMSFEAEGCESKTVMPLPGYNEDWGQDRLIRTDFANLENPAWWKNLQLDGVLLYSWGAPGYEKVARAIRESGTRLVICLDTSIGFYPLYDWKDGTKLLWHSKSVSRRVAPFIFQLIAKNIFSLLLREGKRKRHLLHADIIAVPTPYALDSFKKNSWYYGKSLHDKIKLIPCPIASHFDFADVPKKEQFIAIGRWDDIHQKRPAFLRKTIEAALSVNKTVQCTILGQGNRDMLEWQKRLPEEMARRITVIEQIPNTSLPALYQSSMAILCSSEWEGTHLVSAEALCCGCSVVAPDKEGMRIFQWYASSDSGTLAKGGDTPENLADALLEELSLWKEGKRNPKHISSHWTKRLHAIESVKRILTWEETGTLPEID